MLRDLLSRFHLYTQRGGDPADEGAAPPRPEKLLDELTLEGVAKYIKNDKCKYVYISEFADSNWQGEIYCILIYH